MLAGEHVGLLVLLALRERARVLPGVDVDAPALDVAPGEAAAEIVPRRAGRGRQPEEVLVEKPELSIGLQN